MTRAPQPSPRPRASPASVVGALLVLCLAGALRLSTAAEVLGAPRLAPPVQAPVPLPKRPAKAAPGEPPPNPLPRLRVAGADGYLHLRRMALAAGEGGPLPPRTDRWMHVPQGVSNPWPPLFDAAGGLLARAAGGGPHDLDTAAWAGFALVLGLALLSVLLALAVGARLGGRAGGLVAGLAVAASPAHLNASVLGRLDHHVLEALVPVALFELARWRAVPVGWRALALAVLAAGTAGALPSAAIPLGLGVGAVALWLVAPAPPARAQPRAQTGPRAGPGTWTEGRRGDAWATSAGLLLAALALTPLVGAYGAAAETTGGAPGGSVFSLSSFQPSLLVALAAALAAVAWLGLGAGHAGARRAPRGWRPWAALGAGALAGSAALVLSPGGRAALTAGAGFVTRAAPFTALISESRPLLDRGLSFAAVFATPLAFAAPLLAVLLARHAVRAARPGPNPARTPTPREGEARAAWIYGVLALGTLVLALAQTRFAVLATLPLAIAAGAGVGALARPTARPRLTASALGLLVALTLAPGALVTARARVISARRLAVRDALGWLRAHAAPSGDAWRPETRPAYSVLAPWSYGHELLALGERANVASPYLLPGFTQGLRAALRAELAVDPAQARTILAAHRVRYVLSAPPSLDGLRRYALALGRDPDLYVRAGPEHTAHLTPLGRRTLHRRLADTGGGALGPPPTGAPGIGFLALRYVAPGGGARVYEVVPGAAVTVRGARPGARWEAHVRLAGVFGRWTWATFARADGAGRATLRLPYCTEPSAPPPGPSPNGASRGGGEVRVLGAWLSDPAGDARRALEIPCRAVRDGGQLFVAPPSP